MAVGNFSQAPADVLNAALAKGYVGVHVEQGVPVLDRNLNLLGDLITAAIRQGFARHVGDGTAGTGDFAIQPGATANDFTIAAGTYLAVGISITLPANTTYASQTVPASASPAPLPPLTTPAATQPSPRIDLVYLDLWIDEIDDSTDPDLGNPADIGLRTSTRAKVQFVVRVAENAAVLPVAIAAHAYVPLASLSRPTGNTNPAGSLTDLRSTGLTVANMASRLKVIEQALAPVIFAVAPDHVFPGQANPIRIAGRNFDFGTATVAIGGIAGVVDTSQTTSTTLVVSVPAAAVPGNRSLTVQTNIGTATAAQPIVIVAPPPPPAFAPASGTLAQIVPSHAPAPTAAQPTPVQLTLNGIDFTGVNRVTFNASPPVYAVGGTGGDLVSVTDTVIKVNVPAALSAAVNSSMTVTVSIDGVASMTATTDSLFKVDPQPTPTPAFGPTGSQITPATQTHGGTVTLSGTNFGTSAATTSVQFEGTNGVPALATDFVSISPTSIVVKVPVALTVGAAPANKCRIEVIVQGLVAQSADTLTVN